MRKTCGAVVARCDEVYAVLDIYVNLFRVELKQLI